MPDAAIETRAVQAGAGFLDVLKAPVQGHVHSVFARAVNVEFEGRLLVLEAPDLPLASWGARLHSLPEDLDGLLEPGMEARFSPPFLEAGPLRIDLAGASRWQGDELAPGRPFDPKGLQVLHRLAERRCWPGLLRLYAPAVQSYCEGDPLLAAAQAAVSRLVACRLAGNGEGEMEAASRLSGLGPGLTPAGDDFLGGYLAGRFAQSPGGSRDEALLALVARLAPCCRQTGRVAGAFLACALRGSFSEHLAALAGALGAGCTDQKRINQLGQEVLAFGASSGADALAGLIASASAGEDLRFMPPQRRCPWSPRRKENA
ncbi:MAG: DUF2877 domain-containing protein [Desulfovibrio sp.]|nr:DUF2877 domain-containing protein [Desulfovibrio sp.]